jgi:hypothetical protein
MDDEKLETALYELEKYTLENRIKVLTILLHELKTGKTFDKWNKDEWNSFNSDIFLDYEQLIEYHLKRKNS